MNEVSPSLNTERDRLLALAKETVLADFLQWPDHARCQVLALGGGYGRGEGGLVGTPEHYSLHNDLDLVLIHDLPHSDAHEWCTAAGAGLGPRLGIHVDITPLALSRIARLPPALTWYELGQGHQIWWGNPECLAPLRQRTLDQVHASEWGRLLLNRACGVLFASWRRAGIDVNIGRDEDSRTFATRQIEKAWLALGDVWMADHGVYHDRLAEREIRWAALTSLPPWAERWGSAANYKRRPESLSDDRIASELTSLMTILSNSLTSRSVDRIRPVVNIIRTMQHVPWQQWLAAPLASPRERLRQAVIAEFTGLLHQRERLIGTPMTLFDLWRHAG